MKRNNYRVRNIRSFGRQLRSIATDRHRRGDIKALLEPDHFKVEVWRRLTEAGVITGRSFLKMKDMLNRLGGRATAAILVDPMHPKEIRSGIRFLAKHQLLRNSLEQAMLDFADRLDLVQSHFDLARDRINELSRKFP